MMFTLGTLACEAPGGRGKDCRVWWRVLLEEPDGWEGGERETGNGKLLDELEPLPDDSD